MHVMHRVQGSYQLQLSLYVDKTICIMKRWNNKLNVKICMSWMKDSLLRQYRRRRQVQQDFVEMRASRSSFRSCLFMVTFNLWFAHVMYTQKEVFLLTLFQRVGVYSTTTTTRIECEAKNAQYFVVLTQNYRSNLTTDSFAGGRSINLPPPFQSTQLAVVCVTAPFHWQRRESE